MSETSAGWRRQDEQDDSNKRLTAKGYLRSIGRNPDAWATQARKDLGMVAARVAATRDLPARKVRQDGFTVHTWPRQVWEAAFALLDHPLDEEKAGQLIRSLGGTPSGS